MKRPLIVSPLTVLLIAAVLFAVCGFLRVVMMFVFNAVVGGG